MSEEEEYPSELDFSEESGGGMELDVSECDEMVTIEKNKIELNEFELSVPQAEELIKETQFVYLATTFPKIPEEDQESLVQTLFKTYATQSEYDCADRTFHLRPPRETFSTPRESTNGILVEGSPLCVLVTIFWVFLSLFVEIVFRTL